MQSQLAFRYQWWVFRCHDAVIGRREAVNYICFFDSYVTHQIWVDVWLAIRSWRRPRKAPQEQKIHSERAELQEEDKEYKVWNPSTSRPVPVQSQALDIPSSVTEVGRRYKVARPLDLWSGEHFGSIWWSATSMPTAVCQCSAGIVRNCHFCCWFLMYASQTAPARNLDGTRHGVLVPDKALPHDIEGGEIHAICSNVVRVMKQCVHGETRSSPALVWFRFFPNIFFFAAVFLWC